MRRPETIVTLSPPAIHHAKELHRLGICRQEKADSTPSLPCRDRHVALMRSKRKALPNNKLGHLTEKSEHLKASLLGESRTSVSCHQETVSSSQNALSRLGQEHHTAFYSVRLYQLILDRRRFTITESRNPSGFRKMRNIASN